jgi:peptidoglycan LD-endopeptidase LytH
MRTSQVQRRARLIVSLMLCFCAAGVACFWRLYSLSEGDVIVARSIEEPHVAAARPVTPPGTPRAPAPPPSAAEPTPAGGVVDAAIPELRNRNVQVPIDGVDIERLKGSFVEMRSGGEREHEAVDILAARNTPVHAVEDGSIAKLFLSKAGGNTIYQFDHDASLCYYYAHLEHYAADLREGQKVSRGQVIGYVGTSGNAPPNAPHLHFAVIVLDKNHHWWQGRAIDPYPLFMAR